MFEKAEFHLMFPFNPKIIASPDLELAGRNKLKYVLTVTNVGDLYRYCPFYLVVLKHFK